MCLAFERDRDAAERVLAAYRERKASGGSAKSWRCLACGERSGEAFELCWKCGAERGSAALEEPAPGTGEEDEDEVEGDPGGESPPVAAGSPPVPDALRPIDARPARDVWIETLLALAVFVAYPIYAWVRSACLGEPARPASSYATFVEGSLVEAWTFDVPLILFLAWRTGEGWAAFGLSRPRIVRDAGLGLLAYAIAVYAAVRALRFFAGFTGPASLWDPPETDPHGPITETLALAPAVVLAFLDSLSVGFAEEMIFRGFLITRFSRLLKSPAAALLASTLLFGACHLAWGSSHAVYVGAMGLVYGAVFLLSGRLWPCVLAHALNNFLAALTA